MPETRNPQPASFGGPTGQGSNTSAQGHTERVSRYSQQRKRGKALAGFIQATQQHRPDLTRIASNVQQCASWLLFRNYYTVDQTRLVGAYTCKKHLLCPFCAARRGAINAQKYGERFALLVQQSPNLIPVMLTLTLKNGPDLEERFHHFMLSLRKLLSRRRDWFKKGRGWTELAKAVGGVYSVETTNKGKGWHVHLHAVLLLDDYIDREALSREWLSITGDSSILDVRRLARGVSEMTDNQGQITPKIAEAFAEVFKYALKFSDLSYQDNVTAFEVMRGKRLLGSFGCFRGVQVPDSLLDDPLQGLPYLELIYRFDGNTYQLQETRDEHPQTIRGHLHYLPSGC